MKTSVTFLFLACLTIWLACKTGQTPAPPPPSAAVPAPPPDPLAADRAKYLDRIRAAIKGKEKAPIDSVFQNMKTFKGFPAENLLNIMDRWSVTLGVSCEHCHVLNEWHSDVKKEKNIARQMVKFNENINADLRKISDIKSERPAVRCGTCHKGEARPGVAKK